MNPHVPLSLVRSHYIPTAEGAKTWRPDRILKWLVSGVLMFVMLTCATAALAQNEKTVVARIGDRVITQQEVDDAITEQLRPLEEQIYALRKAALDNMIARALLEDEAKRRGISVDDLKKEFTSGKGRRSSSSTGPVLRRKRERFWIDECG